MVGSNHDKTEKWPEKIILRRRHHPRLNDAIRKPNSPCRRSKQVADTIDAATFFIGAAMERLKPSYFSTVAGEEEEQISHTTKRGMEKP